MPHQLRRHAPAPHAQIPTSLQDPHIVRRRAALRLASGDVVQQAAGGWARESVAESAEGKDGGVQQAGVRGDVEGGEEGGCFGLEAREGREGGVGVGEGGVREGGGREVVAAGAEPEDVPG